MFFVRGRLDAPMLRILIVTPAPARSRSGNRVTALRWARILRELGHRAEVRQTYAAQRADLLVALHARKSYPAIELWYRLRPDQPLVVALTGTDVYGDVRSSPRARQSLDWATRLIVLQPLAVRELPARHRAKARVIYQSVPPPVRRTAQGLDAFDVAVLGHLRPVKDPFRAARALRLLPDSSPIRVLHAGLALTPAMARRARSEMRRNPRYCWLGELPRAKALRVLTQSRLLVVSSRMEGGANVVSEAIAVGTPVLSSRIPGSVGLLGPDYPGYFEVGDTAGLAKLLHRAETDAPFYENLRRRCDRLRPLVDPRRERAAWRGLLRELGPRRRR
jgi:putative glycosyltransferase (TIGR04348 family)